MESKQRHFFGPQILVLGILLCSQAATAQETERDPEGEKAVDDMVDALLQRQPAVATARAGTEDADGGQPLGQVDIRAARPVNLVQRDDPAPHVVRTASNREAPQEVGTADESRQPSDPSAAPPSRARALGLSGARVVAYIIELTLNDETETREALEYGVADARVGVHQYEVPRSVLERWVGSHMNFRIVGGVTEFTILPRAAREPDPDGELGLPATPPPRPGPLSGTGGAQPASDDEEGEGPSTDLNPKASGLFTISSGTVNDFIPDLYDLSRWVQDSAGAPSGATTTYLEYRLRIDDEGFGDFYCGDYEIYLSSQASGGAFPTLLVYNNLGGFTDGGFDDDVEDDADIYLNWRGTTYFNGENPNQRWYVYIRDTAAGDDGRLNYIQFRVYWQTPDYDFAAVDVFGADPGDIWTPVATFYEGDDVEIGFKWTYSGPNPSSTVTIMTQLDNGSLHASTSSFSPGSWLSHWTWTNATVGTHRIRGWCDYYNAVAETNESNNYRDEASAFTVVPGYDFAALDVFGADPGDVWTPKSTFSEGDDVEIGFKWTYSGPNPSPAATIMTQLNNGSLHASTGGFSPGTWLTHWTWTNATVGTHRIRGWCDYYGDVAETNESNNYRDETSALTVVPGYDFAALDVFAADPGDISTPRSTFSEGDDVEIGFTWMYSGPNPSPTATIMTQLDNGSLHASTGSFSPGTWLSHWTWTNATVGTHRIRGWCDYYGDVAETNESNNYRDETWAFTVLSSLIFADGFESGGTSIWSSTVP